MRVIIVDSDTLRAIGLRQILEDRHGVKADIVADPRGMSDKIDENTLFFVTTEAFASMPYFYVPRRQRVALISSISESPLPVLSVTGDENTLLDQIDNIIGRMAVASQPATLSERERQVLRLIALGHINKEIADTLGISFNTVLTHRKNISSKLGMRTTAAMSVYAMMSGLISENDLSGHVAE